MTEYEKHCMLVQRHVLQFSTQSNKYNTGKWETLCNSQKDLDLEEGKTTHIIRISFKYFTEVVSKLTSYY